MRIGSWRANSGSPYAAPIWSRLFGDPLYLLGGLGFFWFVFTGFWGVDGHRVSAGLLTLFFIFWLGGNWQRFFSSPLILLVFAFSGYVAARSLVGYWFAPDTLALQWQAGMEVLLIGGIVGFLLVPWLIGPAAIVRLDWAFGFILLGFFIQVALQWQGQSLHDFWHERASFQMGPNGFGPVAGILLLGVLLVGFRWLHRLKVCGSSLAVRASFLSGWLLVAGALVAGLLASQSRASWLAGVVVLPLVSGALVWRYYRYKGFWGLSLMISALGLLAALFAGFVYLQWGLIERRVLAEQKTVEKLADLEFEELPKKAIGKRVRLWSLGLRKVAERPLWGWSPGVVPGLIERQGPPSIRRFSHVHNIPLQLTLGLGIAGSLLFFGVVGVSLREIIMATSDGRLPFEWGVFWVGALGFLAVEGMFDIPIHQMEYRFVLIFLGAVALASHVERRWRGDHEEGVGPLGLSMQQAVFKRKTLPPASKSPNM
jgi:O-antigen ligase